VIRELFVGRDREVAQLRSGLAEALSGRGALFMIGGESGIGKTRLAEELAAEASERGALVVWGSAWEGGGPPPFWPWVQVVRELVGRPTGRDRDRLREVLAASAPYVAQLVPAVRDALPDLPPAPALESEQARFGLFDAIATFLRDRAAERPLVIVLEDLHWADGPSLLLTEFLARTLHNVPLMALATYREIEAHREPALRDTIGRLERAARRISLGGLASGAVTQLVTANTSGRVRLSFVRRVVELTQGNPLFVEEMMRMLVAEGRLAQAQGARALPLPVGVRETIRRRLEPLPASAHELLAVASVIGVEFDLDTLAGAADTDRDELLGLFGEAVNARVIHRVPGDLGRWRFEHALVRETLYESLAPDVRARLHKAIAENLEQRATASSREESALAYHFFEAAASGDAWKALDYAVAAGDRAMSVLAYEHAELLYRQALRALELVCDDPQRRCGLLIALGEAQTRAGDHAAGRETLRAAVHLARDLDDSELLAQAALRFTPWGLSTAVVDEELVAVLQEALDRLTPADRPHHARLLAHLAAALYWKAPAARRLELVTEAIDAARKLGDPETLAFVLVESHIATWDPDSVERSLPWAEEILTLAERSGKLELALHAHTWRVSLMLEVGNLAGVDESIEAIAQLATVLGEPRARAYVPLVRALRALLDGRVEEAERLNLRAAELASEVTQDAIVPMIVGSQLFRIRWTQERVSELEPAVRQLAETYPMIPVWRCGLIACLREAGREAELRRELDRIGASGFSALPRDNLWIVALALLAESCATLGDAAHAETLEQLLAPFAGRHVVSPIAAYAGPVTRYLGLLASARGDHERALALLSRAREEAALLGARPMLATIALDEARVHAAIGESQPGAQRAREAAALAAELGLETFATHASELADQLADTAAITTHASRGTAPAPAGLTAQAGSLRREGDVWTVQWAGRSLLLRDSKGLRYLAQLLSQPGVEMYSLDLVTGPAPAQSRSRKAAPVIGPDTRPRRVGEEPIAALDERAKREYRRRLSELRDELAQAEDWGDPERAHAAREEIDLIAHELATAVGLGGRDRPTGSTAERARVNVTRAIRGAISRIAAEDETLGHHLDTTVKTGAFCSYRPGPGSPAWVVG
jgi:hypothetical protein